MPQKILAIALCRVSSIEQLESDSLIHQRDNVFKAAETLGCTIPEDGVWSGSVSSKRGVNYNRKDLKEMLEYCKKHPSVKYLIVQEVDRFMRSPDEQVYFQVKFMQDVGVKIWYADKPELNNEDTLAGLLRYVEGFRAAGSNDERQRKSINGQTKALQDGRYPFAPKAGYRRGLERGIQQIHEIRGPILKDLLIRIATNQIAPTQALIELNKTDFIIGHVPYKMDKFRKIITDPFYAGVVEINKQVKVRNEKGLHEPLITMAQHLELLRIMDNKKKTQSGPRKNGNPKYPLSNIVYCERCINERYGRYVGYDHGNGVSKTLVYEKYRCRSCGHYLTRDDLHNQVKQLIEAHTPIPEEEDVLIDALNTVWKQEEGQTQLDIERIRAKVKIIQASIANQIEELTNPDNLAIREDIRSAISNKKDMIIELEDELRGLESSAIDDRADFIKFAFDFVRNTGSNFFNISKEDRLKCKQIIFPAGFFVNAKNKVYTTEISPLYRLLDNIKDLPETEKSFMVRVKRL